MKKTLFRTATALAVMIPALFMAGHSQAEDLSAAEAFYDGNTINWIVPYSPGGGYDEYSRLIIPYFEKYTGARVRLQNNPGAGGMRGANDIYRAPKDGLTVGIVNGSALVTNQLAGIEGAIYQFENYGFLGRMVADQRVLAISTRGQFDTIEQMIEADSTFKIGATGLGGSTYVDALVAGELFDLDQNIIHGFDSSSVIRQAMLRRDIVGMWGSYGSAISDVEDGVQKIVLQSGQQRTAAIPDAPTVLELAERLQLGTEKMAVLRAWQGLNDVGRPVVAPPGLPADRLAFLQRAFEQAMNDPEFLAEAESSGRDLTFANGEQMAQIATDAAVMPESAEAFFVDAVSGGI